MGNKIIIPISTYFSIEFDLIVRKMIAGRMKINKYGTMDVSNAPALDLGNEFHYFIETRFNINLSSSVNLNIIPYFQMKPIGKSNILYLYNGLHEPKSYTHVFGMKIGVNLLF